MTDRTHQPTGCATCDMHGPELPASLNQAALDVHRAWHHAGREVEALLKPTVDWLANLLGRPLDSATGARSAQQGSGGGREGSGAPDAARGRWRVYRCNTRDCCHLWLAAALYENHISQHDTWQGALAYADRHNQQEDK